MLKLQDAPFASINGLKIWVCQKWNFLVQLIHGLEVTQLRLGRVLGLIEPFAMENGAFVSKMLLQRFTQPFNQIICLIFIFPNGFTPLESINRPFKFQVSWLTHEKFSVFVNEKWDKVAPLIPQLKSFAANLQAWNRNVFHNIFRQKNITWLALLEFTVA